MGEKPLITPEVERDIWNQRYPVGTPVRYWPGVRGLGDGIKSTTRGRAWIKGGHTAVVAVHNWPVSVALTHVEVVSDVH